MIHYILLPAEERHTLRREYRLRLAIALLLFLSIAAALGMFFLLPSYLYTYSQVNDAILSQEALLKTIKATSGEQFASELLLNQVISQKIMLEVGNLRNDPDILQNIIGHKNKNISLTSFQIDKSVGTTTLAVIAIEGRAVSRDGLVEFKKSLEIDKKLSEIELPIADLAKSKNFDFSLKFKIKK